MQAVQFTEKTLDIATNKDTIYEAYTGCIKKCSLSKLLWNYDVFHKMLKYAEEQYQHIDLQPTTSLELGIWI